MNRFAMILCTVLLMLGAPASEAACERTTLRFTMIPKKDVDRQMVEYLSLTRALSDAIGLPVELIRPVSYQAVVDGLVSGAVDLAELGPAAYVQAHRRDERIEAFASLAFNAGHFTPAGESYHSVLLVRQDAGFGDLESLRGARVALTDPGSTSGALIPATEFPQRTGYQVAEFFSLLRYAGSHDRALDSLLERRVDAAFVSSSRADEYLARGLIERDTLKELWRSEAIHYDPFVFSAGLCAPLQARIRQIMLEQPGILDEFLQAQQALQLTPVSHRNYLAIERLAQSK